MVMTRARQSIAETSAAVMMMRVVTLMAKAATMMIMMVKMTMMVAVTCARETKSFRFLAMMKDKAKVIMIRAV